MEVEPGKRDVALAAGASGSRSELLWCLSAGGGPTERTVMDKNTAEGNRSAEGGAIGKQPLGVLIVHGFTASLDCVSGVSAAVGTLGVPTRMPVLRGHGAESPEALRGVEWRAWVADGKAALEDLLTEVDEAVVFGHSMGGLVALTLAADDAVEAGSADERNVDSLVVAAPAIQMTSPLAPGRRLAFLQPLVERLLDKWDMDPNYADPELAAHDTNYAWAPIDAIGELLEFSTVTRGRLREIDVPMLILQSRADSTVAPESARIIADSVSTPAHEKRIVWFEETEHEMFRDCQRLEAIETVVDYVRGRLGVLHGGGTASI